MKKLLLLFVAALLLASTLVGCGNEKDRGINSTRDKPQPEPAHTRK
jgi:hypothetical protein